MRFGALVSSVTLLILVYSVACDAGGGDFWNENFVLTNGQYTQDLVEEARKKKKAVKYVIPIIVAALMIKSVLFPLAVKAMAVMSTVAVLMSTLSLIVSSIVGYVKLAFQKSAPKIKLVHFADKHYDTWSKDDATLPSFYAEPAVDDPNVSEAHYYVAH